MHTRDLVTASDAVFRDQMLDLMFARAANIEQTNTRDESGSLSIDSLTYLDRLADIRVLLRLV